MLVYYLPWSGQPRFRTMWERYCTGASAIVFLVDASVPRPKSPGPPASMEAEEKRSQQWTTAREELHTLLTHTSLASVPLLVLATKCDVPGHATHDEVVSQMKLTSIRDREVFCYSISSRTKTNIDVVLRWLCARK
ncbi:lysosomal membrane GTPase [Malassezia pachydermatis]